MEIRCDDDHVWGCPVFVLDNINQSGLTETLKREPRSRAKVRVCLRHSLSHTSYMTLILNLKMGYVNPQYHVVYDNELITVDDLMS